MRFVEGFQNFECAHDFVGGDFLRPEALREKATKQFGIEKRIYLKGVAHENEGLFERKDTGMSDSAKDELSVHEKIPGGGISVTATLPLPFGEIAERRGIPEID